MVSISLEKRLIPNETKSLFTQKNKSKDKENSRFTDRSLVSSLQSQLTREEDVLPRKTENIPILQEKENLCNFPEKARAYSKNIFCENSL